MRNLHLHTERQPQELQSFQGGTGMFKYGEDDLI
jgi:hypothetical protein